MKKEKLAQKPQLIGFAIVILLLTVGVFGYIQLLNRMIDNDSKVLLGEIAAQSKIIVTKQLQQDVDTVKNLAGTIAGTDDLLSETVLAYLRSEVSKRPELLRLVVCDLRTQHSASTDAFFSNVADAQIVEALKNEGVYISDPVVSYNESDGMVLRIATPITRNNTMIGYMISAYAIDTYEQLLNQASFGGEGYTCILKQNGQAIAIPEKHSLVIAFSYDKTFDDIDNLKANKALWALAEDMRSGGSGIGRYHLPGESTKYISYSSLGINDWYLLNTLPAQVVQTRAGFAKALSIYVLVFAVILAAIILAFWQKSSRERQAITERYAYYDTQTGLYRPEKLKRDFAELANPAGMYCVLICLNGLKNLRSMFGYQAEAPALMQIGEALRAYANGAVASRIDAEKFILLVPNQDAQALQISLKALIKRMETVKIHEAKDVYQYQCIYTCGIYQLDENDQELEQIIYRMRLALPPVDSVTASKCMMLEGTAVREEMQRQTALASQIHTAMEEKQLIPYYQLRYDLANGKIIGAELLVRWNHPEYGILSPASFMPVLEAEGYSLALDLYMLEEACKKIQKWTEKELMPVPLSVNISRLNLYKEDFFNQATAIVRRYGIPPILIEMEMTAAAVADNTEILKKVTAELKQFGFQMSMDDFRDGNILLEVLRSLPMDIIKLGRPFFAGGKGDERQRIVLEELIRLTKQLNIKLVAQCIETPAEKDLLLSAGCQAGQGYLLSKPQPNADFEKLIFGE